MMFRQLLLAILLCAVANCAEDAAAAPMTVLLSSVVRPNEDGVRSAVRKLKGEETTSTEKLTPEPITEASTEPTT